VQALIILGLFALLMLVACNRRAAVNIVAFLRDIRNVLYGGDQSLVPGNRRTRNVAVSFPSGDHSQMSGENELGVDQGAQAHEQPLNA
jgi:hypothetical protein